MQDCLQDGRLWVCTDRRESLEIERRWSQAVDCCSTLPTLPIVYAPPMLESITLQDVLSVLLAWEALIGELIDLACLWHVRLDSCSVAL